MSVASDGLRNKGDGEIKVTGVTGVFFWSLEFRFGVKLAMCYRALDRIEKLAPLVEELQSRGRSQAEAARQRLKEFAAVAGQRRKLRSSRGIDSDSAETIAVEPSGKPQGSIFTSNEIDAERSFRRANELDPVNANVHMGLCRSYLNRHQNRRAAAAALKTVGRRYHYPMAHFCLGVALKRMGQIDRAVQALELAASQNPNFAEAHEQLANIHETSFANAAMAREHRALATNIREANLQRQQDQRQRVQGRKAAAERNAVAIDFQQALPKVPGVEPIESKPHPKNVSRLIPRIGQPMVPSSMLTQNAGDGPFVTVVTGLPRSGTSMMMQMLSAGGLTTLTDRRRQSDQDNPRGYFELEAATQLRDHSDWVADAQGKVIKVVAQLVHYLPQGFRYRVIMMQRDLDEVLESQTAMLDRTGKRGSDLATERIKSVFQRQLTQTQHVLDQYEIPTLVVPNADAIQNRVDTAALVARFLREPVDVAAMANAIDPMLYRQRGAEVAR